MLSDPVNINYHGQGRGIPLHDALVWVGLAVLGVLVATYGTVIGAGGGFVLAPTLLFLYPSQDPAVITAMSLGVVWVNAVSGTIAYARQKRIDYLAGAIFATSTVPSALAGAFATRLFPREAFEAAFAVLLLTIAVWLLFPRPGLLRVERPPRHYVRRLHTDAHGDTYRYSFDPYTGVLLGVGIGFLSSLFGVGGGIIFVPVMILLLRIPAHIATATSTFTLVFTAGAGALVHLVAGEYSGMLSEELSLGAGVLIGAQAGALVSVRLARRQAVVSRLLALALLLVGARLLATALL